MKKKILVMLLAVLLPVACVLSGVIVWLTQKPDIPTKEPTIEQENVVKVQNISSPYGFFLNDSGYYESNNNGVHNSYSLCQVDIYAVSTMTLTFTIINYAESNYDFGIFSNLNTKLSESNTADTTGVKQSYKGMSQSGTQTLTYSVSQGSHYIQIKYRKDGSANSGNDSLQFKFSFTTSAGSGTKTDPYVIDTVAKLQKLATDVNSGTTFSGKYFVQTADIDLTSITSWTPIGGAPGDGSLASDYYFSGIYDGGGFTVSNIKITVDDYQLGLFGYVKGGTVKNLNVNNVTISDAASMLGGIIGECDNYSTITNCNATSVKINGYNSVGGIVGSAIATNIDLCSASGTINAENGSAGGVVGSHSNYSSSTQTLSNCSSSATVNSSASSTGGIVGTGYGINISACFNTGNVTGKSYETGGIVGGLSKSSGSSNVTVEKCYNSGTIKGVKETGGIVGSIMYGVTVQNCYNTGSVTGTDFSTGGVVGDADAISSSTTSIQYCYNTGAVTGTTAVGGVVGSTNDDASVYVRYSYNVGTLSSTSGASSIGGITGEYSSYSSFTQNFWKSGVGASYAHGTNGSSSSNSGATSYSNLDSTTYAKSANWSLYKSYWNFSSIWFINPDINNGYPILKSIYWKGSGAGTEASPFLVTSLDDLQFLRDRVNNGLTYKGMFLKQTKDISMLSISSWTPIGVGTYFKGVYDGNDYLISYLTVTNRQGGLFMSLSEGAVVKNVRMNAVNITANRGYTGAIAGEAYNSTIENCAVLSGTISNTTTNTGGIVGYASSTSIKGCYADAGVSLSSAGSAIGGIAGYASYGVTEMCYSNASVSSTSTHVGGIVGYLTYGAKVKNCYNNGTVSSTSTHVGGIVGYFYGYKSSSTNTTVQYCYNKGTVSATGNYVGGIAGYTYSSSSSNTATLQHCYNVGTLSGTSYVGGIVGYVTSTSYLTISNNYWKTGVGATYAIASTSSNTGATSYSNLDSTTYAKNSSWALYTGYWDFANVWVIKSGYNDGYPTFVYALPKKTITFNANGGSGSVASITDNWTRQVTLPTNTFTRQGYVANGWVTSTSIKSTPTYANGANIACDDMTLYANWVPIGMTTKVTAYVEEDIDGDTYDKISAKVSGLSVYLYYYGMSLSGNSTSRSSATLYGIDDTATMRTYQTASITVYVPTGYVCTAVEVNGVKTEYGAADQGVSKEYEFTTGLSGYDSSNYQGTIKVYIKNISGNQLEYE